MNQSIYEFPEEIRTNYMRLMSSKESFLKKLSSAERRTLQTLYDQLTDAWNQNTTKKLNSDLDQKYQELRTMQEELQENCKSYALQYEQELKDQLEIKESILKMDRSQLMSNVLTWKQDIIEREQRLDRKKEKLTAKRSELNANSEVLEMDQELLKVEEEKLRTEEEKLKKLKEMKASAERKLKTELQNLRVTLQNKRIDLMTKLQGLKEKNESDLNTLRSKKKIESQKLKEKQTAYNQKREEIRQELRQKNLSSLNGLLDSLKEEILTEFSHYPTGIKNYLMQEEFLMISKSKSVLSKELSQRQNALTRKLTRLGIDVEDFLSQFDSNQSMN